MKETEQLFSGKEVAQIVGIEPNVLTAWALRGIVTPEKTELVTLRRKNFRYSFDNIMELCIIKRMSDSLSIKYEMLEILSKEAFGPFKKKFFFEKMLLMEDPCLIVVAKNAEGSSSTGVQPDISLGDGRNGIKLEVKLSSWRPEFVNDILNSDIALIVNIKRIRNQLWSKISKKHDPNAQ